MKVALTDRAKPGVYGTTPIQTWVAAAEDVTTPYEPWDKRSI